jgi:hypothetical protein
MSENDSKTFKIDLQGSEHKNVTLRLEGELASLEFQTAGLDVAIYMMDYDATTLGEFLIKHTKKSKK